jgi:hypothetical protein
MARQTRFQKSFENKVMSCEFRGGMFWIGVKGGGETVYDVSIKIGDNCGWSGIQGIPKGILCSHMITALRHITNRSVIEGAFKDKAIR